LQTRQRVTSICSSPDAILPAIMTSRSEPLEGRARSLLKMAAGRLDAEMPGGLLMPAGNAGLKLSIATTIHGDAISAPDDRRQGEQSEIGVVDGEFFPFTLTDADCGG